MRCALHESYPGTAATPLAGIADLPTPLVAAPPGVVPGVGSLRLKRDDLTSAAYGGNKVRKLDFLLGAALAEGTRTVLTFGAYGSNHALATAVHARALGLEPHVVLWPQAPGPFAPRTLLAHAALGTVIHCADDWSGEREAEAAIEAIVARDGQRPYGIPMGGSAPLGAAGYVNAALEMVAEGAPDVVYTASGTLGTAVGLALGFAAAGATTRVEAVRVTPEAVHNDAAADALIRGTSALLHGLDATFPLLTREDLALTFRQEFFEPGYGVVTPHTLEAVERAEAVGLRLETTYTGKAFSALLSDAGAGMLADASVVFVDTYNSAPFPPAGDIEALPEVLRAYIAECRRQFPEA